eukprot:UN32866
MSVYSETREELRETLFKKAKNKHAVEMVVSKNQFNFHEKSYSFKRISYFVCIVMTIYAVLDRFFWNPWPIDIDNPMKKNWSGKIFSIFAWISGRTMIVGVN